MLSLDPNTINAPVPWVLHSAWQVFFFGFVGGILADLLAYAEHRRKTIPGYFKTKAFWAGAMILAALGGIWALSYGSTMEMRLALNMGLSAPFTLKAAATSVSRLKKVKID